MKNDNQVLKEKQLQQEEFRKEERQQALKSSEVEGYLSPQMTAEEMESEDMLANLENELDPAYFVQGGEEGEQPKQLTEQQKQKKEEYQKQRIIVQQLKKRFMQQQVKFKQDAINKFIIDNPKQAEILMVYQIWAQRNRRSDKYLLHLQLTNCTLPVEHIKKLFHLFPSVKITVNQQPIQNNGILKVQGDRFFQGQDHYMTILGNGGRYQYTGQVANCTPHGNGQIVVDMGSREGYLYKGQFLFGKMEGKGMLQSNKGIMYIGSFKDNLRQGEGEEEIFANKKKKLKPGQRPVAKKKSTYVGTFKAGMREGQGRQVTPHGTYDGEWKQNLKDGDGEMTYKNGDNYKGNWARGQFSGQGQYTEHENCTYVGEFLNGKYHGNGVMTYKNGDIYEGEFEYGRKHGNGKYDWEDGDYYDGEWRNDSAEGHGTSMFGPDFFDGEFKNGVKHGQGELTNEEGDITRGIWQNDKLVKTLQINGQMVQDD